MRWWCRRLPRVSQEFEKTGGVVTGVATESVEHTLTDAHIPGTTTDPFDGDDDVEGSFGFPSGSESDGD